MILGIGIDSVEIERFTDWVHYPSEKLLKFFTQEEIEYCLAIPEKSAERFAARFAAKEAFFKAISSYNPSINSLLKVAKQVALIKKGDCPFLQVHWNEILPNKSTKSFKPFISITHSKALAIAFVIIEKD